MDPESSPLLFPPAPAGGGAIPPLPKPDNALDLGLEHADVVKPSVLPWPILIVDDEEDVHSVTHLVLADFRFEGRPLEFLSAYSMAEAVEILLQRNDIAVALVDVVMETDDAGLRLVRHIREMLGNTFIRLILRTGQPGVAPEKEVIVQYDINDYKAKTELSSIKLLSAMLTALRSYRDIVALNNARCGMERLMQAATDTFLQSASLREFAHAAVKGLGHVLDLGEYFDGVYALGSSEGVAEPKVVDSQGMALSLSVERVGNEQNLLYADLIASKDNSRYDLREIIVRLRSRYEEDHFIDVGIDRDITALDKSLVELFRLRATAALDNLLLLEKSRAAQSYALRALVRLGNRSQENGGRDTAPSAAVRALDLDVTAASSGGDFYVFLNQLAVQAETAEWGRRGAIQHIHRIGAYAGHLAMLHGMPLEFCEAIRHAAQFHDVGKIAVAPGVAAGWFEPDPDRRMQAAEHTRTGFDLMNSRGEQSHSLTMRMAAEIALHHHETWRGGGYPDGLSGAHIPISARIVAVVDFFDVCTRSVYKGIHNNTETLALMRTASGHYFDASLVKVFVDHWPDFVELGALINNSKEA